MVNHIVVPPGIGDFSWIWSKFSTTDDKFFIEYADTGPERLEAFLKLLPKDKIVGWAKSEKYKVGFNIEDLEMIVMPGLLKLKYYNQFKENPGKIFYVEANTHLERGNRIEEWMPSLKTDFHYEIQGKYPEVKKLNMFIVHLSSSKMQRLWKCYGKEDVMMMIRMIQKAKDWTPLFVGAEYDDFAMECAKEYIDRYDNRAINLIGNTCDLRDMVSLLKRAKLFLGLVSSGLTMMANVLSVPSISWWPRPGLPKSWADQKIMFKWFLWKDFTKDYYEVRRLLGGL
ncbi:MAG: hypothetical protein KAQ99_08620 [Candidatus Aureabacteria bacterium]|nr:hypothetical protein [Candidatus Auribacterota bacterium]